MKSNTFIKDSNIEDLIYLDNQLIGEYKDMLNIIIHNPDKKYYFENFNKIELKVAKIILKSYSKALKNYYRKNEITITTHKLRQKLKKHYYLDSFQIYKDTLSFETIDKVEFKRIENKDIIIIEGTMSVYGINNEYGFYSVDQDNFIPIDEIEENKKIAIEALSGPDVIHYVKRRVR